MTAATIGIKEAPDMLPAVPDLWLRWLTTTGWGALYGALMVVGMWVPGVLFAGLAPLSRLLTVPTDRVNRQFHRPCWTMWIAGLVYFLACVRWVSFADPNAWVGWLLMASYLSVYFPLTLLAGRLMHLYLGLPVAWSWAIAWTATEYLRNYALTGFGWHMLAHAWWQYPILLQSAEFAGVYAITFLTALIAGIAGDYWPIPGPRSPKFWPSTAIASALLLGALIHGALELNRPVDNTDGATVVLVQTNVEQQYRNTNPTVTLRQVLEQSRHAYEAGDLDDCDVVIWPETSYNYFFPDGFDSLTDLQLDELRIQRRAHLLQEVPEAGLEYGEFVREAGAATREELTHFANVIKTPILLGVPRGAFTPDSYRLYNCALLVAPEVGPVGYYDKMHLVPFGEYLPFEGYLPILEALLPYQPGIDFGVDAAPLPQTIKYEGLHFGAAICFEDTVPQVVRRLVMHDPAIEFLVNQSNDGWFLGTEEPWVHLAAGLFRAIEHRRPLVRAGNTGGTCAIDSQGRVIKQVVVNGRSLNVEGYIRVTLPLDGRTTFYTVWGDWLPQLCWLAIIAATAVSLGRALTPRAVRDEPTHMTS